MHTNNADQCRIAYLGDVLKRGEIPNLLQKATNTYVDGPKWADIHLTSRPPFRSSGRAEAALALLNSAGPNVPFRVPGPTLAAARSVLGLDLREVKPPPSGLDWDGAAPISLVFRHRTWTGSHLAVTLGRCACAGRARHWARMKTFNSAEEPAAHSVDRPATPSH